MDSQAVRIARKSRLWLSQFWESCSYTCRNHISVLGKYLARSAKILLNVASRNCRTLINLTQAFSARSVAEPRQIWTQLVVL